MQRLRELRYSAEERRRLLDSAKRELQDGFVAEALDDLIRCVGLLSHAEETVMQLHTECFSMIEHSRKVLEHEMTYRPLMVVQETPPIETYLTTNADKAMKR